jgi:hypothetical protein
MEDWLKEASKNLPAGSDKFTDIVRDVSEAGQKVLKEGRRMAKQAAEAAEQGLADLEKMTSGAGKKSASPESKKPAAKKVARKTVKTAVKTAVKAAAKKVANKPASKSTKL